MNYYAAVFLLRPPNLVRRGPFFERKNVCNSQEHGVQTRRAAIVNHPAVLKILRVVNLLCVVFLVRRGPLGRSLSGPSGPKCPGSVPLGVPRVCLWGPSGPGLRSVQKVSRECPGVSGYSRDTFWRLRSPGPEGPQRHPEGHSRHTLGRKGPKDSCSRPGGCKTKFETKNATKSSKNTL